jgi:hypothetical protein
MTGLQNEREHYKLWTDDNHAIYLYGTNLFSQKLGYIHENPVRQMIVANAEEYIFSSTADSANKKGLVDVMIH